MPGSEVQMSRRALAESIVHACGERGTRIVFGVPGGGSNLDVVGAAVDSGMRFVLAHTETAATVMAAVSAQLTGAPGLAVATRGPGAASAANGMAQALLDRQAAVLVTDCVAAGDRDRVSHQRLDQQALMAPVAKASVVLDGRHARAAALAVGVALSGRPGPVHVDLDLSAAGTDIASMQPGAAPDRPTGIGSAVRAAIAGARRPVVVVGSGAVVHGPGHRAAVCDALRSLGATTGMPMLCTYQAKGMVPHSAAWSAGLATGATIEQPLLDEADLVVGIGLDPIEFIPAPWRGGAVVLIGTWQVDDSAFFGDDLVADVVVHPSGLADAVREVAECAAAEWESGRGQHHRERAEREVRAAVPVAPTALTPQEVVDIAAATSAPGTVATVDAGAHMLVAMPLWPSEEPDTALISSGLATMGFALPAAIAAALAYPDRRVVCFTGDGGIGMCLAELETLARLHLAVTVVVFDDASLSLIASKQSPLGHGGADAVEYRSVDFAAVAAACGVPAVRVASADSYRRALSEAIAGDAPMLIDAVIDPSAYSQVLDAIRGERPARATG